MAARMPNEEGTEPAVVLVTGASRGLGRGIADELARDGLSVAIHYATNRDAARRDGGRLPQAAPRAPASASSVVARRRGAGGRPRRHRRRDPAAARPARRPREQRGHGAAGARRPAGGRRRRASTSCMAVNLKGPYFLSQRRGAATGSRHRGPEPAPRRLQARVRLLRSPPTRPPSTAATTASPRPAWPWPRSSSRRAWPRRACRSSSCGPASWPPT